MRILMGSRIPFKRNGGNFVNNARRAFDLIV